MSSFTEPLATEQLPGGRFRTLRDLVYWTDCADSTGPDDAPLHLRCRTAHTVPAGFESDGVTMPRLLWPVFGHPMADYAAAAYLHDWLLQQPGVTREEADRIFREALGVLGVGNFKRQLMYLAVRANSRVQDARKAPRVEQQAP